MKKILLSPFLVFVLFVGELVAQANFVPLKIDSSYSWTFSAFGGDTLISETWNAYSYDGLDSLIQLRRPNYRFKFSYNGATTIMIREELDSVGNWVDAFRKTSQLNTNGRLINELSENLVQGIWSPSSLLVIQYSALGKDTFSLRQFWGNAGWENAWHRDRKYDFNGNMIEEAEYFYDNNGEADFNRGELFEYDAQNRLVQQIHVNGSINGPYYTSRLNWHYNEESQIDTLVGCHYNYPSLIQCTNVGMATYQYFTKDSIWQSQFNWVDEAWNYYGRFIHFLNSHNYGPEPDSILFIYFSNDSQKYINTSREYFHYEESIDGKVFYSNYAWNYLPSLMVWVLNRVEKRWYHKSPMVDVKEENNDSTEVSLWPNPCKAGEALNIKLPPQMKSNFICVFDSEGRKILNSKTLEGQAHVTLITPNHLGVFTIVLFLDKVPVAMSKVLIH